jgi:hypothetical protein
MDMPNADWLTQFVRLGPPVLLVVGLLFILQASANGKMQIKKTLVLSGIVATFFALWLVSLPLMNKRRIYVVTTNTPMDLVDRSLRPIRYKLDEGTDNDLATFDFMFPENRDTLKMQIDLNGLILSYENNLKTVLYVAQRDPDCFADATQGVDYSRVAAKLRELCPGSVRGALGPPAVSPPRP